MEFEVFLSFRGSDTRDSFTSCLYHDMIEKGIRVFKDDEELGVGEKIEELFRALDDSQIYIPIFSENFASSVWCLREVTRMVDRASESEGKKEILPLFLDVKPEDVKSRTGWYSNALSKHEGNHDADEVKRWRDDLREVASRVGWKLEGKEYGELIKLIVREVLLKLTRKNRRLPNHLVETDDLQRIEELLDVDNDGHVRFIVIHGTGGIGKSTLASVIFNRFRSKFNCSSFLEDVRSHHLLDMQKKLMSETLGSNSTEEIYDTNDGIDRITRGLGEKKVLVVVDNVDKKEQLENLAGSCDWFGCGSRIIVTLRDIRIMRDKNNQVRPSNYMDYSVKEMPMDQAIQLFSKHVFRSDFPPKDRHNFSVRVVSSVGRLPLTLEIVGSLFHSTNKSEWGETLKDLQQVPREEVRDTLMLSFNKLDCRKKHIFLDIACFCIGEDKTHAYYMWDDCGYSPHSAIDDLYLMSLIKIDEDNTFWMHDEVRDFGRYIVKEENFEDAGKRRWVWIDENTLYVLRSNEEKPAVRALSLGISHNFTPQELARFPSLRFLGGQIMNFTGNFENLLPNLRWLSWHCCPPNLRAENLHLVNLVMLDLSWSKITHEWGGWRQIKMASKLKVLNLAQCQELRKTPDFSEFGKLEKLILSRCMNLSTIDSSIGKMKRLSTLDLDRCDSLQRLPEDIGSLECLSEISLTFGHKLIELPKTLGNLKSLTKFEMIYSGAISQLPHSIGRLTSLTHLILYGCNTIHELPNSLGELKSLVELDIRWSFISFLPDSIGNLKRLKVVRMGRSKIQTIPCTLGQVETLEELDASICWHMMDEIPWQMWSLPHLRTLDLGGTTISTLPPKISGFSNLQTLKFSIGRRWACPWPELPSSLKFLEVNVNKFNDIPDLLSRFYLYRPIIPFCRDDEYISPWENVLFIYQFPRSLSTLKLLGFRQLPDISDLGCLSVLTIEDCKMPHFPTLKFLERLKKLKISSCRYLESTPDLSPLKRLEELDLRDLGKLTEIPGLGQLESLKFLHLRDCYVIEQLPNLSKLKNLQLLMLFDCDMIEAVEGLEILNSLKNVHIHKCKSLKRLPDLPAFTKLATHRMPPEPPIYIIELWERLCKMKSTKKGKEQNIEELLSESNREEE